MVVARDCLSVTFVVFLFCRGASLQSPMPTELQTVGDLFRTSLLEEVVQLSQECIDGFSQLMNSRDQLNISKFYRILDAFGKPEAGILDGNIYAFGSYDECLDTGSTEYCILQFSLPISTSVSYSLAVCLPATCNAADIFSVINSTELRALYIASNTHCVSQRTSPYSAGAIAMIVVCCLFVLLVAVGTIVDMAVRRLNTESTAVVINYSEKGETSASEEGGEDAMLLAETLKKKRTRRLLASRALELLTAFSLTKTLPAIFSTTQPPNAINCINGIRVISMFWVIMGHVYFFGLNIFDNTVVILDVVAKQYTFQPVVNAFFSVDSFFFLSGLLTSYLTLQHLSKRGGRFPWLVFYLHRYLRLTPTLAFVMFFWWSMAPHILGNAHGNEAATVAGTDLCRKYWWSNLLYINNFYPNQLYNECVSWVWYLADDMQFYVISPLILYPLYRWLPLGVASLLILLVASLTATGAIAGTHKYTANIFLSNDPSYSDNIYIKPYCRISPYLVGLALGYIFFKKLHPKSRLHGTSNYILHSSLWVLAAGLLMSCLYGLYGSWHGHLLTDAENITYIMLSRLAWGVGLACMTYACHSGYGGWVNWFLSLGFWVPLSRLTYSAYLVHPVVLAVMFSGYTGTVHYTVLVGVQMITAGVVLSYTAAGALAIFVEFPLSNLEALLFKTAGLVKRG